jgi:hypothetical protein
MNNKQTPKQLKTITKTFHAKGKTLKGREGQKKVSVVDVLSIQK